MATQKRQPTAFVIMPFEEEFSSIYAELVVPSLRDAGFEVSRADSVLNQQNIMKDVVRGIAHSDLVVAELTELNANVFYELGIAHGLNRPTVLIAQSIEHVPFDLRSYRVIVYSTDFREVAKAKGDLREVALKAVEKQMKFGNPVSDFLEVVVKLGKDGCCQPLPVTPTVSPHEPATPRVGEKGFLDWIADAEEALVDSTGAMSRIGDAMVEMTKRLKRRTAEIEQAARVEGPGRAARMRELAAVAAKDILDFVEGANTQLPVYKSSWEKFEDNTVSLLASEWIRTSEQRQSVSAYRQSVRGMVPALDGAISGLGSLRDSTAKIRGMSGEMNRAADQEDKVVREMITELKKSKAATAKILMLLDEILGADQPEN